MPERRRTTVTVKSQFDLRLAAFGHGWIDLAPHRWVEATQSLATCIAVGRSAFDVDIRASKRGLAVEVTGRTRPTDGTMSSIRNAVIKTLRIDEDLSRFWAQCEGDERLAWVARRGAGRLMRSASLFEDLMKLLFTTNCSWGATRNMTTKLVGALGTKSPTGRRTFPTAKRCAQENLQFWKDDVRTGYRAQSCLELAQAFASGAVTDGTFDDPALHTNDARKRLQSLRGIGPYAAGQALRLIGRYDDLALDSWCRNTIERLTGSKKTDPQIADAYAAFGRHRGLALWMDLTADWHGEGGDQGGRPF